VPVRRRTTILVVAVLGGLSLMLCSAHYASVAWPSIAYHPEIARPLRLDRPDSFGRWFVVALLAGSAGLSLLIYQLRRYRSDDYKGRYRLWRLVLVVMALASVNSLVSIIDWGGALLDAGFGKRVALTGSDWIRLVVSFGGVVLALQLIVEVRRCRFALGMMILACALLAIPEAAKWNVLRVDSIASWATVTSAPLLAFTSLFISLFSYLRMLYREVRQIEDNDSLIQRLREMRSRLFQRSADVESDADDNEHQGHKRRGSRWRRSREKVTKVAAEIDQPQESEDLEADQPEPQQTDQERSNDASTSRPRRRWFGLRRKPQADCSQQETDPGEAEEMTPASRRHKKRRLFSMRQAPPAEAADEQQTAPDEQAGVTSEQKAANDKSKRRRGLGGWLRRKQPSEAGSSEHGPDADARDSATSPRANTPAGQAEQGDEIDWNSLSKSERRRLRKQLKRQRRVA
jgi:hypothetical protein